MLMLMLMLLFFLFVYLSRLSTYFFTDESEIWIQRTIHRRFNFWFRCNPFESLNVLFLLLWNVCVFFFKKKRFYFVKYLFWMGILRWHLSIYVMRYYVLHLLAVIALLLCFFFQIFNYVLLVCDDLFKFFIWVSVGIVFSFYFAFVRVLSIITKLLSHFTWTRRGCARVSVSFFAFQFRLRYELVDFQKSSRKSSAFKMSQTESV